MNNKHNDYKKRLGKRHRIEKRFRIYTAGAIMLACAFLIFFFFDIISKGYTAFLQAEVKVEISYSEEARELPFLAVTEEMEPIVSRTFLRQIPRRMEETPELLGTTRNEWVLAEADVDQYVKDRPNRLGPAAQETVERLREQDRLRQSFNSWFFLHGDSKLPEQAGIKSAVVGSIFVLIVTLLCSVPIGVLTSIYLEEFAPENKLTRIIEVNINNLAAIPSILFGLLGLAIFINFFGAPRSSALAGGLTLGLMMLPIMIISTRAALRAVPGSIRQGAQGVGASPWQVIQHHVLPLAMPGILTGAIIGLAQSMGETAPLLIVGMMAYIPEPPNSIFDATTVLPAQIYTWSSASLRAYVERTAAAIMVLLAVLLTLNATAIWLRKKYERKW